MADNNNEFNLDDIEISYDFDGEFDLGNEEVSLDADGFGDDFDLDGFGFEDDSNSIGSLLNGFGELDVDVDKMMNEDHKKFDNRFYVHYLGLLPNVIYKEDEKTLELMVKLNLNAKLFRNLVDKIEGTENEDGFLTAMEDNLANLVEDSSITEEEIIKLNQVADTFKHNWSVISNLYRSFYSEYDDSTVNTGEAIGNFISKKTNDEEKLFKEIIRLRYDDFIRAIVIDYEENKDLVKKLCQYFLVREGANSTINKFNADLAESMKQDNNTIQGFSFNDNKKKADNYYEMYVDYISTAYSYTPAEFKALRRLGFPTLIRGKEDKIKNRFTPEVKSINMNTNSRLTESPIRPYLFTIKALQEEQEKAGFGCYLSF